jgi:hypothetical protein
MAQQVKGVKNVSLAVQCGPRVQSQNTPSEPILADNIFSWLHFSDLHVGMSASSYLWPNVEDIILSDLEFLHDKSGPWDAIFFTGDLVQTGSVEEFSKFDGIMKYLREALIRLGSEPIFLAVPGNHDLVRPAPNGALTTALATWKDNATVRSEFWNNQDSEYRRGVSEAFANWQQWASAGGIESGKAKEYRYGLLPGDFAATLNVRGIAIGVLGLNTAGLQIASGDYKGRLSLHPCQLQPLFPDGLPRWAKQHHACLIMSHHSLEWLDKEGRTTLLSDVSPPGRFALHLNGHQHEPVDLLVSQGGAKPRITLVGSSLFGLKEWGDPQREPRIHGYSAGRIYFASDRLLRVWPRRAYLQQAGHLRIDRDESLEKLDPDDGMTARSLGAPPIPVPPQVSLGNVAVSGWFPLTSGFLAGQKRELTADELGLFFDGQEPSWAHALSDPQIIPQRRIVGDAVQRIVSSATPVFIRLLAAGGEGKSLALKQIAVQLAESGLNVLFREDEGVLNPDEVVGLPIGGKWVLVTDDADRICSEIYKTVKLLHEKGRQDVSWIIAARDTDWFAALREANLQSNWSSRIKEWPRREELRSCFALSKEEAVSIVAAWAGGGVLGALSSISSERQAQELLRHATAKGEISDATLFGGILETRITKDGLRAHVVTLMHRLRSDDKRILGSKKTLYYPFLLVSICDAVGIPGVDLNVLAYLVNINLPARRSLILHPLGLEAAATASGSALRIRHPAIAREALSIAVSEFGEDLSELYCSLIKATLKLLSESISVSPLSEILWCGPRLIRELPSLGIRSEDAQQIAITVAAFSQKSNPEYMGGTLSLAGTYRHAGMEEDAVAVLNKQRDKVTTFHDWKESGRAYIFEYSVCKGRQSDKFSNIWLAALSIADFPSLQVPRSDNVKKALAGIGAACMEIIDNASCEEFLMTLRAVAVLGECLGEGDAKGARFFSRYKTKADRLGAEQCSIDEAFGYLVPIRKPLF